MILILFDIGISSKIMIKTNGINDVDKTAQK